MVMWARYQAKGNAWTLWHVWDVVHGIDGARDACGYGAAAASASART